MVDKLDLDSVDKNIYILGKLKTEIIQLLKLDLSERDIVIWRDRVKYLEKHKTDFETEIAFNKHVQSIPEIINNPDYVGLHPRLLKKN